MPYHVVVQGVFRHGKPARKKDMNDRVANPPLYNSLSKTEKANTRVGESLNSGQCLYSGQSKYDNDLVGFCLDSEDMRL